MTFVELPEVDAFGPEQVIVVNDAAAGLTGYVVVDNLAAGPAIGGVRMAADVRVVEVARLARAMTLKNAAAGLPHGGAKGGIVADPAHRLADKVRLVRAFGHAIRDVVGYIPGPDMGLDEGLMAHLRETCGRAVGLPAVLGGIPLDVLGATGFGLAVAAEVAAERGVVELTGARVVVQGFGSVGTHAARFLGERGARPGRGLRQPRRVATPDGLDVGRLIAHKAAGHPVARLPRRVHAVPPEALLSLPCDIWVPAARPDVFTADNVGRARRPGWSSRAPTSRPARRPRSSCTAGRGRAPRLRGQRGRGHLRRRRVRRAALPPRPSPPSRSRIRTNTRPGARRGRRDRRAAAPGRRADGAGSGSRRR